MRNLTIIESTQLQDILPHIPSSGAHFTNGTYAYSPELIIPTTLAGFDHVYSQQDLPMVIAVNSDHSMVSLNKFDIEDQLTRANKVAIPLAKKFPNTQIIVIFYDEKTPNTLYQSLAEDNLTKTLHKWGYGTTPEAPKIEGAEFFQTVYAFPLPNDKKPVCYYDTSRQDTPQQITVVDLRDQMRPAEENKSHDADTTCFISQAKQFISNYKYSLFAAGAATAAISAYYRLSNRTADELVSSYSEAKPT